MKPKKIVLTGPESSGKTTLAQALAQHYQCEWVPEYARQYLNELNQPYEKTDLLKIAQGQVKLEDEAFQKTEENQQPFIFLDTDLITIKIWSDYKYQQCDYWIEQQIASRSYDLYLLCLPDIPWQADPLREGTTSIDGVDAYRKNLLDIYKSVLKQYGKPFFEIGGLDANIRLEEVVKILTPSL